MLEIDGHLGADKGAEDEVDDQIQLVLDLSQVDAESTSLRDSAQHIRVGAVVRCVGVPKSDRPGSLSVYLQTVDIIRCSPEPDAIMRFLADEAADGAMIVCKVLDCNLTDYQELKTLAAGGPSKAKQLKQAVAKHSRTMVSSPFPNCILNFCLTSLFGCSKRRWESPAVDRDKGNTGYPEQTKTSLKSWKQRRTCGPSTAACFRARNVSTRRVVERTRRLSTASRWTIVMRCSTFLARRVLPPQEVLCPEVIY